MQQVLQIIVEGRVQGVGFRAWTADQARSLGVSGFVRNRTDGSVEIQVAGNDEKLSSLCGMVQKGPPMAKVTGLMQAVLTDVAPGELPQVFQQAATV